LNLHAANLFAGPVLVSQGYLGLYHNGAMGSSSGLTVTNLGIVQMFNVGITGIPATLSGNGNGNGCVRAFDTNFWTGPITLAGNAGIQPFAAKDVLILDTSITGNGNLTKLGAGKLSMTGSDGNNYQGRTFVNGGTLELGKSGARSIPGPLTIGDATNAANSRVVRLTAPNQIADTADVMINASGVLDLDVVNSISEAIGSLAGAGNVRVGANKLASGTNDATTTFSGSLASSQSGSFEKYGDGTMFLTGNSPGFAGSTFVKGGVLSVNGSLSAGTVYALANGTVAGDGVTGVLAAFDGKITPGDSPGLLQSGNFGMSQDAMLEVELDGTAAGVTYDQIAVTGFVNLGNANLRVLLGFSSAVSNRFVIIANDGNDVVVNTFKNLPEGAPFFIGTAQFQISYQGGDGNDVELTQVGVAAPPQIGLVKDPGNGQIQITGNGMAGAIYDIQANSDLNTTNWTKIGTVPADLNGLINFTDVDATNFMMRFYRLKGH
jgi:autotransporter-associated beta strand protein